MTQVHVGKLDMARRKKLHGQRESGQTEQHLGAARVPRTRRRTPLESTPPPAGCRSRNSGDMCGQFANSCSPAAAFRRMDHGANHWILYVERRGGIVGGREVRKLRLFARCPGDFGALNFRRGPRDAL